MAKQTRKPTSKPNTPKAPSQRDIDQLLRACQDWRNARAMPDNDGYNAAVDKADAHLHAVILQVLEAQK